MSLLSDKKIIELVKSKEIIKPFEERYVTPAGYDLRLGDEVFVYSKGNKMQLKEGDSVIIEPRDFVKIKTLERLKLSREYQGIIFSKVGLVSKGLSHFGTKVDPGFNDNLVLTFTNLGNRPIEIRYGDPICCISLDTLEQPAEKDYYERKRDEKTSLHKLDDGMTPPPMLVMDMEELNGKKKEMLRKFYGEPFDAFFEMLIRVKKDLSAKIDEQNERINKMDTKVWAIVILLITILITMLAAIVAKIF